MAKVPLRGLKGRLVLSSIDAYVLALETINRLSVRYRIESFNFLIINAWELLLKAWIIHEEKDKNAIFEPKAKGQKPVSLGINKCIRKVYQNANDPIRVNLETMVEERDKSVHLVLDRLPKDILAVYQACVVNYHQELEERFGISVSDRIPAGMMTLVFQLAPENFDLSNAVLRQHLGADAVLYLMERQAAIEERQRRIGENKQFAAEVKIRVEVVPSSHNPHVILRKGTGGREIGIVEKPRDPADTHPHRLKKAVEEVKAKLPEGVQFNNYDVTCINHCHHTKANNNHYFQSHIDGATDQYSDQFINWVIAHHESDPLFFEKCRSKYRAWYKATKQGDESAAAA